jgi:outer membrane protein assembly factor BamB
MDGLRQRLADADPPSDRHEVVRWLRRHAVVLLIVALLLPAAHAAVNPLTLGLGPGTVQQPAEGTTYVSVQGFTQTGDGNEKKPTRLVAAAEDANVEWRFQSEELGTFWFYDVDPLDSGNLLVSTTYPNRTMVMEFDPDAVEPVWTHDLPINDTHDVARMPDGRLLVANMREFEDGVSNDRIYVYDRENGTVDWEWRFRDHFANDTDGGFKLDWTHVNDVDVIDDEGRYVLTSPRNFDQVVVVDRETDEIVLRLGEDDNHEILDEQHNPDYLEREDGTPVLLVADSENDRVVEYERDCGGADPRLGAGTPPEECEWDRVWTVEGFNWPRDADRLPNGNTLVTDTLNHRAVEITPDGEVVWEFHASWGPYDAERGEQGSNGPAISDQGAGGTFEVHGGDDQGPAARYTVADAIADVGAGTPLAGVTEELSRSYAHLEPWIRPTWMSSWAALSTALGVVLAVGLVGGKLVARRRRLYDAVRSLSGG